MATRARKPKAAPAAAPSVCNLCEGTGTVLNASNGDAPTSYACPQCRPAAPNVMTSSKTEGTALSTDKVSKTSGSGSSLPPLDAVVPDEAVRMAEAVFKKWGSTAAIRGFYTALANFSRTASAAELPDIAEARHVAALRKAVPLQ